MSETTTAASANAAPMTAEGDAAFAALRTYNLGSDRAALIPIDDAARASAGDAPRQRALERRLTVLLRDPGLSVPAKEYLCAKLALIGSASAAPALAQLLPDRALAEPARLALEAMPCAEAVDALRDALPQLSGTTRVGVVNSLGRRRDTRSVSALAKLLGEADVETAGAAAAALGEIGTTPAAAALREFQSRAPEALRLVLADACLCCAEQLHRAGETDAARSLVEMLARPPQPDHVRQAAERARATAPPPR